MVGLLASTLGAVGCSGSDGAQGAKGDPGSKGDKGDPATGGSASVNGLTPALAYLGRTVDVIISGDNTSWDDKSTVDFGDAKIKVNSVKAASPTALVANITVDPAATIGAHDIKVTDAAGSESFKATFAVKSPLAVTVDQPAGVEQGGLAIVHLQMLDLTTPFDANNISASFSSATLGVLGTSVAGDFSMDILVQADVNEAAADVDILVSSGAKGMTTDSPAPKGLKVAARTPDALTDMGSGKIATYTDTSLFKITPADAGLHFIQTTMGSMDGLPTVELLPKDGKWSSAIVKSYGLAALSTQSTDPIYAIVGDTGLLLNNPFAPPPPYSFTITLFDSPATAAAENEGAKGNDTPVLANAVAKLPGLVQGAKLSSDTDVDYFKFNVPAGTKTVHIASAGVADIIVKLVDVDGVAVLATSLDATVQEDLTFDVAAPGDYFVEVSGSPGYFDPAQPDYELFVDVK